MRAIIKKTGEVIETADPITLQFIASTVKFIQTDESKFATMALKDIVKQTQGKQKTP